MAAHVAGKVWRWRCLCEFVFDECCSLHQKMCVSVALGFDSYAVIRFCSCSCSLLLLLLLLMLTAFPL